MRFSRIPLYHDKPDAVIGFVLKDDLVEGAVLAGSPAMLAIAAEGAITLTF